MGTEFHIRIAGEPKSNPITNLWDDVKWYQLMASFGDKSVDHFNEMVERAYKKSLEYTDCLIWFEGRWFEHNYFKLFLNGKQIDIGFEDFEFKPCYKE